MIDCPTPTPQVSDPWARARFALQLHRQSAAGSSIVKLQAGGSKPPFFLVHGVGSGMFWGYANLARALGLDQPVYAFKSRGLAGLDEFTTIEAMATQYVTDLRRFQSSGPYYLGGYCFGGNVAYEMARQLRAQDQQVGLLLLLNCWPNNSSYTRLSWTPAFFAKFAWNLLVRLRYQIRVGAQRPRDYFKWRSAWLGKRIRAFCVRTADARIGVEDMVDLSGQSQRERSLWRTHVRAWLQFTPLPYDGEIVLLRTRGHPLVCSFDHRMGWGAYAAGGVTVRVCRGDHESILEQENVEDAARHLRTILEPIQKQRAEKLKMPELPLSHSASPASHAKEAIERAEPVFPLPSVGSC